MVNHPINYLMVVWLALLVSFPSSALGDLWRCGTTYTDHQIEGQECVRIGGTKVCGSDGNKYYSPSRGAMTDTTEECAPSQEKKSPFAILPSKDQPLPTRMPEKKLQAPPEKIDEITQQAQSELSKLGMGNIPIPENVVKCVVGAIEKGTPPEKCADLLLRGM